jgi:hypothetical protein
MEIISTSGDASKRFPTQRPQTVGRSQKDAPLALLLALIRAQLPRWRSLGFASTDLDRADAGLRHLESELLRKRRRQARTRRVT